mmetsp:Transcript_12481/g.25192  ORF Transcript_12481/g.25192 Transcript_12481/m.25192 type:complete len:561 (-) Transcript_12481:125-1807(-)
MACARVVSSSAAVALAYFCGLPALVGASAFRGAPGRAGSRSDLLDELEATLGAGRRSAAEGRVAMFEDAMRPIFQAMPRNGEDRLPASGVRYLLHRVFVERHGWFVEGLTNAGESWNSSSPAGFFAEHVGDEVHGVFERRLGDRGLSLHETAVFAATLESLVHEETLERLHSTHHLLGLDAKEDSASEKEVEQIIDAYMLMLVLGLSHTTVSREVILAASQRMDEIYPNWHQVQKWVREVRKEVVSANPESRTTFATTANVLEEVAERYGRWQDSECIALKGDLMKIEKDGTGRVPLQDFYSAALNGSYQFTEKREYLRQLGALDESQASHPSVIIPNYINSASNCLASSKFYSVCCINECESLLKPLERHIGAPDALPSEIVALVEKLPSSTVDAPRQLPASLTQRLEEIAAEHGGRVPLHGRLFSQWMHHAFPRECPYPHASGTTQQMTPQQFHEALGEASSHDAASLEEEIEVCRQAGERAAAAGVAARSELPWAAGEELFVQLPKEGGGGCGMARNAARAAMMLLAVSSLGVATLKAAVTGVAAGSGKKRLEKYLV